MTRVGIYDMGRTRYPRSAPYHPSHKFPEYPFAELQKGERNDVYNGVRELLHSLKYDIGNFGSVGWNPLKWLIKPGMTVIIKPNFVLDRHRGGKSIYGIITHPAVIRAVSDYCWIALAGKGKIIIADAPQYDCNFTNLIKVTGLDDVCNFYRKYPGPRVSYLNLQNYWSKSRHFSSFMIPLRGDPKGSVLCDLKEDSALWGIENKNFYGAFYDRHETISHHTEGRNIYELSRSVLEADVYISLPKMKVHKKVGVTLNGKGLVGICTNKNSFVHYRLGTPSAKGDQFPDKLLSGKEKIVIHFERWMYDKFLAKRQTVYDTVHRLIYGGLYLKLLARFGLNIPAEKRIWDAGNWPGNDTAWRGVADLFRIIYYYSSGGRELPRKVRKTFSIVDGIVGGENMGPLVPDPKRSGILVGGESLLAVDVVSTRLMGFNPLKIKQFAYFLSGKKHLDIKSLDEIEIVTNNPKYKTCLKNNKNKYYDYKPYPSWKGALEI